jgi:acetolactate synthase I/II/III large subunit
MQLNDALVKALIDLNVQYVFGVSGANIEHLHDAIHRIGDGKLHSILTKSEDGAAFMADCRARVHRTLGVCCSTSGGGMMNLIAGIAESYAESVPVLALVGQPPSTLAGLGAFQDSSGIGFTVDSMMLWQSVAKYVGMVSSPEDFWVHLVKALRASLSGRPGPVVLLFPRDVFEKDVGEYTVDLIKELAALTRPKPIGLCEIYPLFEEICKAENPLLILGSGVRQSSDPNAVVAFARSASIPVVTTLSGRGEFPNNDPLYLGTLGVAGHPSAHFYLKEKADLLIVVGSRLDIMTRHAFDSVLTTKKIAVVDVDTSCIARVISPTTTINGDAGIVFNRLLSLLEKNPSKARYSGSYEIEMVKPSPIAPLLCNEYKARADKTLMQSDAMAILQKFLPERSHLLFDAGNCAATALHMTTVPPGSSSTIALGMGGMGYAISGAIGAQLGSPFGTRTVVFAGDGAFLMTGFEIHTAVDLGLPILFLIFNNNMHGMCVTRQRLFFESRLECNRYSPIDVYLVAQGFGKPGKLWTGKASTVDELLYQLNDYESQIDLPGVLELCIYDEEIPPFTPFLTENPQTVPFIKDKLV